MSAITQSAILLVSLFNFTTADYECLCNYHVERAVYPAMTNQDNPLGHLYEFDCKPTYRSQTPKDWQAIQFGRKVRILILSNFSITLLAEKYTDFLSVCILSHSCVQGSKT